MDDARPEVTCRIDRIARRSAQREADDEHQQGHGQGVERAETTDVTVRSGNLRRGEVEHAEDEHKGTDDLRNQIVAGAPDLRRRREYRQLRICILTHVEVKAVMQPDEERADHRSDQLSDHVR